MITVAKTAGFCFGVSRAINIVEKLVSEGKTVCTLGPIIHNPQMVKDLAGRGVMIADTPEDVKDGGTLVIRSHGVSKSVMDKIKELGIEYEDATCPFVLKIHKIVAEHSAAGEIILIAGDENHPEVKGIIGHCTGEYYTFANKDELVDLLKNNSQLKDKLLCIVSQTTFDTKEWKKSLKILQKLCTNAKIFVTICSATSDRQSEAELLAGESDLMIVIGGRHSSNTNKLYHICKEKCDQTYLIETADEIPLSAAKKAVRIGITAGASTPASIIKEVLVTMSDEIKNVEESKDENFAELLEESMQSYNTNGKVHGVVVGVTPTEVRVDVGRKQTGIIPLDQLSNDPNAKTEDLVKIGDELDLIIMRTNDQEGTIQLSQKILDAQKGWDEILEAYENKTILHGTVIDVNKGGVIALTSNGVRVFIPASQATANRGADLESLLKTEVDFRIIETTGRNNKRRAVGSIRSVLDDERKKKEEEFWASAEEGKVYNGVVKSLMSYGAFVDIGGIDGMVHISELSWNRIKHPSEVVNVGDQVEVYIKSLDREKGKISLGYKKTEDNPWEILKNQYPEGTVCEVEIVGLTTFGAFAKIIDGIDGLIHVSQISNDRIEKPEDVLSVGQKVSVKITAIDFDKKRISLSMKAVDDVPETTEEE